MEHTQALTRMQHQPPPPPPDSDDEGSADSAWDWPVQRLVASGQASPAPVTRAASSIFTMADAAKAAQQLRKQGRFGAAPGFEVTAPRVTVIREGGTVKVTGGSYPANRWDEQRAEQERVRRAKQKPPRPTRKARTRGRKLLDMIGTDDGNE